MGNSIRQQCCGDRGDDTLKSKADELNRKESVDFASFQEAVGKDDVPMIVNLLASNEPFENKQAIAHPWAARPLTVGTLAGYRIAAMANDPENLGFKDRVREAGAVQTLVSWLNSQREDQRHASVIALSILNEDVQLNCDAMVHAGAIPKLVKCLEMQPDPFKVAAASACRNIYVTGLDYRKRFVDSGGVQPLVNLIDINDEEIQGEAIMYLEDLLMDTATEIPMCVEAVKEAGVVAKLEKLKNTEDLELARDVENMLSHLAD